MRDHGKPRVLVLVVAHNAESHLGTVLDRIPREIWEEIDFDAEVLVIDDASTDRTTFTGSEYRASKNRSNLTILRNPVNLGYGGNQKVGFHYAIKKGFDFVVLLDCDGQPAPELLPRLLAPLVAGEADAVFGTRVRNKREALRGGMPLHQLVGNVILTRIQNVLLGSTLSEFQCGYRAFRVEALRRLPFEYCSNGLDFDTDAIIQFLDNGLSILEIPIPTSYSGKVSRVKGLRSARDGLKSTILSRLQRFQIYHHPKFDYPQHRGYPSKVDFPSSHRFALDHVAPGARVLDIGCGPGWVASELRGRGCKVYGVDSASSATAAAACDRFQRLELDSPHLQFDYDEPRLDAILLLDVVEHVAAPEELLRAIRERFSRYKPEVVLTTANVGFFITRLSLALGQFNYGRRGILDFTHKRLFTFRSFRTTLEHAGLVVEKMVGLPAPFPLIFGAGWLSALLVRVNELLIRVARGLFSYQVACVARLLPTLEDLLQDAMRSGREITPEAVPVGAAVRPDETTSPGATSATAPPFQPTRRSSRS